MDREKKLQEAEKILQGAGYRVSKGLGVNISLQEADCGEHCTGGCHGGCYTCSTGTSNALHKSIYPTIQFPMGGIIEDLVTIGEGPGK